MRDDQKFEIERAFDLLPHVCGASWATTWFRVNQIKNPTREEFRNKTIEFFDELIPLFDSYPDSKNFLEIKKYIKIRYKEEVKKIKNGESPEIEKRIERYLDYG